MADHLARNLKQEFPDLSQSTLGDVLQNYGNNKDLATKALREINDSVQKERQDKVKELLTLFPSIRKKFIKEVLEENGWDIEAAILPLFNKAEELKQSDKKKQEEASKKKRQEEEAKRKREEAKKQADSLLAIFHNIPKQTIQKMLDENEGDVDETTNQLLDLVAQQEDEKKKVEAAKKEEEERRKRDEESKLRELMIQALSDKFPYDDAVEALQATNWDIKKALALLVTAAAEKKKEELKKIFSSISEEEITSTLHENDWDLIKAAEVLKDKDRKKKDEALRIQQEQEASKKSSSPSSPPPSSIQPPIIIKKVEADLLQSSMMIAKKMEEEISASHQVFLRTAKDAQNEAAKALFREDLENIIAVQARHGVTPGMAPPLVREIDQMLGKPRDGPVMDENPHEETGSEAAPPVKSELENRPLISNSTLENSKNLTVTLTATPDHPDIGNPIVVNWEITSGHTSTSYDWIGLYNVDQQNKQYVTYQWVGKDKKSGQLTFYSPYQYGQYELRYFTNNTYSHVDKSNLVTVGPQVELTAILNSDIQKISCKWKRISGNDYARAWIGLFEKSQTDNRRFIAWEYANKTNNVISFDAPLKPTFYEFRFFTNSYVDITRSNAVRIEGQDSMTAVNENNVITLNLNILSVDPYYDSAWIGLYLTHEADNRQWRRYKYVQDRTANVQFNAPKTPGEYEARLFANKTYDLLLKSNKFIIAAPEK